jgi:hypothetical protein
MTPYNMTRSHDKFFVFPKISEALVDHDTKPNVETNVNFTSAEIAENTDKTGTRTLGHSDIRTHSDTRTKGIPFWFWIFFKRNMWFEKTEISQKSLKNHIFLIFKNHKINWFAQRNQKLGRFLWFWPRIIVFKYVYLFI